MSIRTAIAVGAGVLGLLAGTTVVATASTQPEQQPIPPTRVTQEGHADPTVAEIDGEFWTYATYCCEPAADGFKVAIRKASSIEGPYEFVDWALAPIPWARTNSAIFAPDVHRVEGSRVLLYFAATPSTNPPDDPTKCVGVAISTTGPAGPFVPEEQPISCDPERAGIIDPSYFEDPVSGKPYLLYKTNGIPRPDGAIRRIWLQEMTPDGLGKVGAPVQLAERNTNMEHPELVYSGERYFLFVSRDLYRTSDYKTSALVSVRVDSGYANERAVLTSQNTNVSGPGGADILRTSDGRTIAYHHGWIERDGQCDGYRPMYVSELAWDANDRLPHLAVPTPGDPRCNV